MFVSKKVVARFVGFSLLAIANANILAAQDIKPSLKREFRAAWIATVYNIDWPSSPGLHSDIQKRELVEYLDLFKSMNFNAVFLQIRPSSDALYLSKIEPWSRSLSGVSGSAPSPFYDPLEFAVKEAHKRGLELHAWINPFRVLTSLKHLPVSSENHPYNRYKKLCVIYRSQLFLDPGYEESRDYLTAIVEDIVSRYDIDGIHLDDYFYPNRDFDDSNSFSLTKRAKSEKEEWRRDNVNRLIESLRTTIKSLKPFVKFGISPAAKNSYNYNMLSADLLYWLERGWIDYAIPQIYFCIGDYRDDFTKLAQWWSDNAQGTPQFAGLAAYKLDKRSKEKAWRSAAEIRRQIEFVRALPSFLGVCFYSAGSIKKDLLGVKSVIASLFAYPALLPHLNGIPTDRPPTPTNVGIRAKGRDRFEIFWTGENFYYVLYRFKRGVVPDFEDPTAIVALFGEERSYVVSHKEFNDYDYYITGLDRVHNESAPKRFE